MGNGEGRGLAVGGSPSPTAFTAPPNTRPRLTHMAMSLASPGVRPSSGPTSFTAEKWSCSWGQESAMWGSWYTSWRWRGEKGEMGRPRGQKRWCLRDRSGEGGEQKGCRKESGI